MASVSNEGDNGDVSSDDEFLATCSARMCERVKRANDEYGDIIPEILVKVEMKDMEDTGYALDLSQPKKRATSPFTIKLNDKSVARNDITQNENVQTTRSLRTRKQPRFSIPIADLREDEEDLKYSKRKHKTGLKKQVKKVKKTSKKEIGRKRTFPCPICDATFQTGPDLKLHSVVHEEQTRHKCEECGRCFSKAFSLKTHKRSHFNKEHKCPFCDRNFPMRLELYRHMRIHKRTEACGQCTAKFHTKEQLAKHVSRHEKEANSVKSGCSNDKSANQSSMEDGDKSCNSDDCTGNIEFHAIKAEVQSDDEFDNDESKQSEESQSSQPAENVTSLKREDLSSAIECAIINKMYKGRPLADICRLYNLTADIVNEIWEDRDKFARPKKVGVKTAKYMNGILDTRILEWFNSERAKNIHVSGKMLQDRAEEIARECGFVAFNGNMKWLERFKKKHSILLKSTPVRRDYNAPESKWKTLFFKETWSDARLGVPDDNIYTADEVGVFFNPSKSRTKKLTGKKFIQGLVKDRLSIFMCTNITGTDKKKLVVCGSDDPLVRSHRHPNTLPVMYIRHNEAHFTTQIFEEYVRCWNRELQAVNRKAVLILDRATIHSKLKLSNLKLVFVPWKTSGLIPIRNGIYGRFRNEFRRLMLQEKAANMIRGVDRNLTCLEALYMLEKAWDRVPPQVVTTSFEVTGFDVKTSVNLVPVDNETPKIGDNDDEVISKMLKDYDVEFYFTDLPLLDMYLTVDEEFLTGQGTNCSVFGGNHKVSTTQQEKGMIENLPIGTERPGSNDKESSVRKARAMADLEIVRTFLQQNDTSFDMYSCFMKIENFLYSGPFCNNS